MRLWISQDAGSYAIQLSFCESGKAEVAEDGGVGG